VLLLCLAPKVVRAEQRCGSVCSETWTAALSPYLVTCDLTVDSACLLTIEAGVEVRFSPGTRLTVAGALDVAGTGPAPVQFTSDAPAPQAGDWGGLYFYGDGPSSVRDAIITYADYGVYAGYNTMLNLERIASRWNLVGLAALGAPTVNASGCSFVENSVHGVDVGPIWPPIGIPDDPSLVITSSSIHSNQGDYDFHTNPYGQAGGTAVDARGNWWGTTDTVQIANRIFDRSEDRRVLPVVDRCGYLDGPGGSPVADAHCPDLSICDETVAWDLTDKPYQVTGLVEVCPTGTLNVGPGVRVGFVSDPGPLSLTVWGVLDVSGTGPAPAEFTSDAAAPQAGDWGGLLFYGGGPSSVRDAVITYADYGVYAGNNAVVSLERVTSRWNLFGLAAFGGFGSSPTVNASRCSFVENAAYGVYLGVSAFDNPAVVITDCSIHSNEGTHDFYTDPYAQRAVVNARGNWWGTTDTLQIASRIRDRSDHGGWPVVDRCGYLDGPGGLPVADAHCPDLSICDGTVAWDLTDKPYQVTGLVEVCPTGTLNVGQGVRVGFVPDPGPLSLTVWGVLDVSGTGPAPVEFTSDAPVPQAGDWGGLYFYGDGPSSVRDAVITYADYGVYAGNNAVVSLEGVTSRRNRFGLTAFGAAGSSPTVNASGSAFVENAVYGVHLGAFWPPFGVPDNPSVLITTSSIHSNQGDYDVYTDSFAQPESALIWMPDCWWGSTDADAIRQRIYDHEDTPWTAAVHFQPSTPRPAGCDRAIGRDLDGDGFGDVEDNCPLGPNGVQADEDGDRMGDACDPEPQVAPIGACDGADDGIEGYVDGDGDGWGDPCDFHPTRSDSYPGAPELCDGRDNDGDGMFGPGELEDTDRDEGIACGDCDDLDPVLHPCACEDCTNLQDEDCDALADGADPQCTVSTQCLVLRRDGGELLLDVGQGSCGLTAVSPAADVIRGDASQLQILGGSVDLGRVACLAHQYPWDRVEDPSADPNPACDAVPVVFYLARESGDPGFGSASGGETRDTTQPDPPCP
jgi:hypothetical protein